MELNIRQAICRSACFLAITIQLLLSGCATRSLQSSFFEVPVNPPAVLTEPGTEIATLPYDGRLYAASLAPTGSMRPTLLDNDLILYAKGIDFASVKVGDIVLFHNPENRKGEDTLVCHRVVYRTRTNLVTKGDNNPAMDPFRVEEKMLYGKLVGVVRGPELPAAIMTVAANP